MTRRSDVSADVSADAASRTDRFAEPRLPLSLAWAALAWEKLWPALWPALIILGVLVALALFDFLPDLPGWVHLGLLAAFAIALVAGLVHGLRRLELPAPYAVRRRLEHDSGLRHRPLTALLDAQATGTADPGSRELWRLHQERLVRSIARWRVKPPTPGLGERDRFGVRALLSIVILLALVGGWGEWRERFARAFSPNFTGAVAATPPILDLSITPPAYTGLAPVFLRADPTVEGVAAAEPAAPQTIDVPVGSTVLARVSGGEAIPTLALGATQTPFTAIDPLNFELTTQAAQASGDRITVTQGTETLGTWPVRIIPDAPPVVAFAEPPGATERQAVRLDYQAQDDYGLETAKALIALKPDAPAALSGDAPIELELSVPGRRPKEVRTAGYFDLTPHPWAGLPVTVQISATDGAGQSGVSETVEMVLPERAFVHPIAQAIIDQRRTLMREPDRSAEVAEVLEDLSVRPDRYYDDPVVFLALRTAARRLTLSDDVPASVPMVQKLLWDTALRIEDGDLSLAERELRELQKELAEALENGATDAEIQALMDELRQALDRYLQAMQEEMMERMARGEQMQPMQVPPENMVNRDQLQQMLDQMQQLSESGAREQAQQMLSQLQEMLENLQMGMMAQEQQQQQNQMMELLNQLENLTNAQRELLDQTFQNAQQGQQGQPGQQGQQGQQAGQQGRGQNPGDFGGQSAQVQEALRRTLGDMMRQMGEMTGDIPTPFGRAEQSMRQSEQALRGGQSGDAVQPQTDALDQLQQGLQGMVDQMMEQMAEQGQQPGGQPGQRTGQQTQAGRDPLGRPLPNAGGANMNDVDIPEEGDIQRSRAILDELRRRLGERSRPELELDYIERLLRRF